jgi:formylglycine-generating enzyme required for sulfatase activity
VDPSQSDWAHACCAGGTKLYSYGTQFQAGRCPISPAAHSTETAPVGTPSCEGGFDRLFDLGGGEREWIDDCILDITEDGPWPECADVGSNDGDPAKPTCVTGTNDGPIFGHGTGLGLRCCADVLPSE